MITALAQVALLVREYEEAKSFYCDVLGFVVIEDKPMENGKRWVRLKAPGGLGSEILLSRAVGTGQEEAVGKQAGGRVFFFLHTDAFDEDYERLCGKGVRFTEGPFDRPYGKVGVFEDLYGNRIDLISRCV